jgi:hypothetical protein
VPESEPRIAFAQNIKEHDRGRHLLGEQPHPLIGGRPGRNGYGAIAFEPHGTATTPVAFTQLFRNGEIWGVTGELAGRYYDKLVVPMVNVSNIYRQTLASYIATAKDPLGVPPPYDVEMGAPSNYRALGIIAR